MLANKTALDRIFETCKKDKKDLAQIFRILVATLLKKELFSLCVKSYGYKLGFSGQKQENSE